MATQHNFRIKNGLEVAGTERISSAGAFTGSLASATTATTQSATDNSTKIATTAYTDAAITAVIGGAPGTLDTLNELAAAINDDASYASTLTTALATKLPLAGGTMTGNLVVNAIVDADNFKINGGQGSDGQVLTSTGSGVAWEDSSGGLPLSGGTLTGTLNITQASTADTIKLTRGTTSHNNMIKFVTGSSDKWIVGQRNDSTDHFRFYSYGTSSDVLSIQTDGNVNFGAGLGIGGTGAANTLDDYEEGTWTPAFYTYSGVTTSSITNNLATYTKIGNIVHIHANIDVTLSSLPGQIITITGLPFAASNASATGQRAIIALGGDTANMGGNTPKAHFRTNGSQLDGVYYNASNNTAYWYYNSMDSPTFALHIHGFYTT